MVKINFAKHKLIKLFDIRDAQKNKNHPGRGRKRTGGPQHIFKAVRVKHKTLAYYTIIMFYKGLPPKKLLCFLAHLKVNFPARFYN
jgi:hypothetical protein